MIKFKMPYPPQNNHYYTVVRGRKVLSTKAKNYRIKVWAAVKEQLGSYDPIGGRLFIDIMWFPPDKRKRDGDNILKGLFDSLKYSKVINDDAQFKKFEVEKGDPVKDGFVQVEIKEWKWRLGWDAEKQKMYRYKD